MKPALLSAHGSAGDDAGALMQGTASAPGPCCEQRHPAAKRRPAQRAWPHVGSHCTAVSPAAPPCTQHSAAMGSGHLVLLHTLPHCWAALRAEKAAGYTPQPGGRCTLQHGLGGLWPGSKGRGCLRDGAPQPLCAQRGTAPSHGLPWGCPATAAEPRRKAQRLHHGKKTPRPTCFVLCGCPTAQGDAPRAPPALGFYSPPPRLQPHMVSCAPHPSLAALTPHPSSTALWQPQDRA